MGMQGESLWGWSWDRVLCWDLHKHHEDIGFGLEEGAQ